MIFKILMQGPLEEDLNRISTKSFSQGFVPDHVRTPTGCHQDLQELCARTCTISCKGPWQNSTKTFARSSHKEL